MVSWFNMNVVERCINHLLNTKPFYANFFLGCRVSYSDKSIPTAAVKLDNQGIMMLFNPEFLTTLTFEELQAVIEHETLHLLFDHLKEFGDKSRNKMLANIAMDLAINQYIENLPKGACTVKGMNKQLKLKMLPEQTWEYYYAQLEKAKDKIQKTVSIDEHLEQGHKLDKNMSKAILKQAVDSAIKASNGVLPKEVLKVYDNLNSQSVLPWQQILANFVSRSVSSSTQSTRKRSNRRFGLDQPGRKKKRELTLGVCVDSSGSISDDQYSAFLTEIVRISKTAQKTYLVEADCVVQSVQTIKKNKQVPMTRKGCGGTAYQPAITKCLELKCDAIIYFGDFDSSDTPVNPGVPFLWVGVGSSKKPGDFGQEVRL